MGDEIKSQQKKVKKLMRTCRQCQEELEENRDVLVLHCQQFAFAKDMVGPCADILTCRGTDLPYRADIFNGNPYGREHEDKHYDEHHYDDSEDDHHDYYYPEESRYYPVEVGHYSEADVQHEELHAHTNRVHGYNHGNHY